MFVRRAILPILYFVIFTQYYGFIESECPPDSIIEPCSCVLAIPSHSYILINDYNPEAIYIEQNSFSKSEFLFKFQ
jgi:hypothetical protein